MNGGYHFGSGHTSSRYRSAPVRHDHYGHKRRASSEYHAADQHLRTGDDGAMVTESMDIYRGPEHHRGPNEPAVGTERGLGSRELSTTEELHRKLFSHYRKG